MYLDTVPFLTRFFRAYADDIKIPDRDPPDVPRNDEDLKKAGKTDSGVIYSN